MATAAHEGRYANEGWRVRKNGERFLASVVIDPIYDEAGTPLIVVPQVRPKDI
jgi:hypothetical protein